VEQDKNKNEEDQQQEQVLNGDSGLRLNELSIVRENSNSRWIA